MRLILPAQGFQNNFTGTNGNIHISWLGKLRLSDGVLAASTYVAEYAEGTGALGARWLTQSRRIFQSEFPDGRMNTTRLAKNNLKVTAAGWVCVTRLGRRTITTANAYQKMVQAGQRRVLSCWNSFIRVYKMTCQLPCTVHSLVGQWDTLTQQGGGNTELFGIFKRKEGS